MRSRSPRSQPTAASFSRSVTQPGPMLQLCYKRSAPLAFSICLVYIEHAEERVGRNAPRDRYGTG